MRNETSGGGMPVAVKRQDWAMVFISDALALSLADDHWLRTRGGRS
jgi:hypothetical protein